MRYRRLSHANMTIVAGLMGGALVTGVLRADPPAARPDGLQVEKSTRLGGVLAGLFGAGSSTPFDSICNWLTIIAEEGKEDPRAGEILLKVLPENSPLYRDRSRAQVQLLRGGVLATLARVGPPAESLRWIRAELATSDDPFVFGAACRAAAALGPRAAETVPDLQRAFGRELMDQTFSLRDVHQRPPLLEPTTAKIEAVNALRSIGPGAAKALPLLREVAEGRIGAVERGEELRDSARRTILALSKPGESEDCCCDEKASPNAAALTEWHTASRRPDPGIGSLPMRDQDGREFRISDFRGKPVFVSFFYTRCDNLRKCSRTVSTAATLRDRLARAGLATRAHIVLISLDPLYDDPLRLQEYARTRGFRPDRHACVALTSSEDLERVCRRLDLPVNFEGGRINTHGVAAVLLDGSGRLARSYHSVTWDNEQVVRDLERLASE